MLGEVLFYTIVAPLLIGVIVSSLGLRPWNEESTGGEWSIPIAAALAISAVLAWIKGVPSFPAVGAMGWLFWLSLVIGALGVVEVLIPKPMVVWPMRLLATIGGLRLILDANFTHRWETLEGWAWVLGLSVAILATLASLDAMSERKSDASFPAVLAASAGLGAFVVAVAKSLTTAQAAGALALVATVGIALTWRRPVDWRGANSVFVILVGFLWVIAFFFADVNGWSMLLVAAAPQLGWIGHAPVLKDRHQILNGLARAFVIAIPMALALGVSELGWMQPEPSDETTTTSSDEEYDPYSVGEGSDSDTGEMYDDPYSAGEGESDEDESYAPYGDSEENSADDLY